MIIGWIIPYYMTIIMTIIMHDNRYQCMIIGMHFNFMIIGWIIGTIVIIGVYHDNSHDNRHDNRYANHDNTLYT